MNARTIDDFVKYHQGNITVRIFTDAKFTEPKEDGEFLNCKVRTGAKNIRVISESGDTSWEFRYAGQQRNHIKDGALRFCITKPKPYRFIQISINKKKEEK